MNPRTDADRLPDDAGAILLPLARAAIARDLDLPAPPVAESPTDTSWLDVPGASFVTLHRAGRLRGCIGSLEAHRPLRTDVEANARSAAFRDPRFSPLTPPELAEVRIEVSVLSAPVRLPVSAEAEVRAALRPGVDGVVLEHRGRRGTFLPQVWAQLPDPATFLDHLRAKAVLPEGFWDDETVVSTYTVTSWEES